MQSFTSDISHKPFPVSEKVSARSLHHSIFNYIKQQEPGFDEKCYLSLSELNRFRYKYIADTMVQDLGELDELEKIVVNKLRDHGSLTRELQDDEDDIKLSFGQRLADKVADFGGSWTFIVSFLVFIAIWMAVNIYWLSNRAFDPYPFILLNLILSCLAAFQAPIIMMSQNRQEDKDRQRAKKDYMINLKSELEVRMLHEKMDHLIIHQQQQLLAVQEVQVGMMKDLMHQISTMQKSQDKS